MTVIIVSTIPDDLVRQMSALDPSPATQGAAFRAVHRRVIYFSLVGLFVVQSGFTWTSATAVPDEGAAFNAAAERGAQLYRDFNCTACHQFYGLGGYMGPDLTNVTVADGKGEAYTKGIILSGTQRMPALGITPQQADDLVAYLNAAAATGHYPIRSLDPTAWGTYRQMHTHGH